MSPGSFSSAPPLPPDVVGQQSPPSLQFMQNAGAAQNQQAMQSFNAMAFVKEQMTQVVNLLKSVADVLIVERPAMVKQLQIMGEAGSAIMNEVEASSPDVPQSQMPQSPDQAGAVSMS